MRILIAPNICDALLAHRLNIVEKHAYRQEHKINLVVYVNILLIGRRKQRTDNLYLNTF
jgi:hypothetical protein